MSYFNEIYNDPEYKIPFMITNKIKTIPVHKGLLPSSIKFLYSLFLVSDCPFFTELFYNKIPFSFSHVKIFSLCRQLQTHTQGMVDFL